jgi:DNA-binding response OmpR family regulator
MIKKTRGEPMPNILIIDDDASISEMLSEALENEGYTVSKAYSGTEAMMFLSQSQPDLVLLDLMLPGLSGKELLPHIKDIPVMVVSAKAVTDTAVLARVLDDMGIDYKIIDAKTNGLSTYFSHLSL